MTYSDFKAKYLGKTVDWDNAYGGQCVDLFRYYVNDCLSTQQPKGVAGAADFWANYETDPNLNNYFTKIANTPEGVPQLGDVMIWTRRYGPYGHIAIVDSATVDSFTCLSQNDPAGQPTILKTYKYTNVYGWFHPKETMLPDEIAVKKTDFENLVKKSTMLDEILAKYQVADAQGLYSMTAGKDSRITDLTNQLGTAQAEVANRTEQVSRLKDELITVQNQLKERTDQVNQFAKEKGELAIQVEQLKVQVDTLKAQQVQGELTLTIGEIFKLLWNQKITITKG